MFTAVFWAQAFARTNRQIMMKHTLEAIGRALNWPGDPLSEWAAGSEAVNCHHNYVAREHHFGKNVWVTRKGAVPSSTWRYGDHSRIDGRSLVYRAREGESRLVPFVLARRRSSHVAWRGEEEVFDRGSRIRNAGS